MLFVIDLAFFTTRRAFVGQPFFSLAHTLKMAKMLEIQIGEGLTFCQPNRSDAIENRDAVFTNIGVQKAGATITNGYLAVIASQNDPRG